VCEAMALVAAVVIGFVGVSNHEMRLTSDLDPVREFVVERIPIIEKATCFDEQASRVWPRSARSSSLPDACQPGAQSFLQPGVYVRVPPLRQCGDSRSSDSRG
jgi:hypothetical protein